MKKLFVAVAAMLALGSASAQNLITNGDFEAFDGLVAEGSYAVIAAGSSALTGWTVAGASVDLIDSNYGAISNVSVDLAGTPGPGTLSQSFAVTAGQAVQLDFDYFKNGAGTGLSLTFGDLTFALAAPSAISHATYVWTPTSTGLATLSFSSGAGNSGPTLDNVAVTVVPEPETYAMMLAGLSAMGFLARRRKSKA